MFFLPRDAIPARYMLSSRVRLSVRTSVTSRHCTETTRRTELIFCELPLTYPELFVRKFGHLKNKGTSLWNFTPNAGLRKFRHGESMVWSTKLVDGRAFGLCLRRSSGRVWMHIVYYTSVDCNALTPLPLFWICCATRSYTVVQQLAKFCLTHRVARSISGSRASCVILEKKMRLRFLTFFYSANELIRFVNVCEI